MSGFDRLKEIGAQKIHEKTHITKQHVQAILHESFEGINKIQFLGFLSILEREYGLNLDDLKSIGLAYYSEQTPSTQEPKKKVFLVTKKKKNYIPIYIGVTVVIFAVVAYFTLLPLSSMLDSTKVQEIDNSAIESAKTNISLIEKKEIIIDEETDENKTIIVQETILQETQNQDMKEDNTSKNEVLELQEVVQEPKVEETNLESDAKNTEVASDENSLKILPKSKVWMGYIDLKTHRKRQKTFANEFDLDAQKEYLFLFGHGYITVEVNGVENKFSNKNNLRLLYKDGKLTKITTQEFKDLNNGSKW